jgi:DNA-binding transcriptional regulator YiaG
VQRTEIIKQSSGTLSVMSQIGQCTMLPTAIDPPVINRMTPLEFFTAYPALTHQDLADLLGTSKDAVDSWCSGKRNCPEQVRRHIAHVVDKFRQFEQLEQEKQENSLIYAIWLDKVKNLI